MGDEEVNIEQKLEAALKQLAQKDDIITNLNARIAALEESIKNQSVVMSKLNDNFSLLNNQLGASGSDLVKRKKVNAKAKPLADGKGPMDNYIVVRDETDGSGEMDSIDNSNDVTMVNNLPNLNQNSTSSLSAPATFASVTGAVKSVAKPMPLQLGVTDRAAISQIVDLLINTFEEGDFDFVQLKGGSPPRIFPKSSIIKAQIMQLFQANNIEFNSYSEKGDKHQSYIVRGLNYGDDAANISHIRRALADIGILSATECGRFLTGHMKRAENANTTVLYRFTLSPGADVVSLSQIKSINGFRVIIEKMRKSIVIQCHRCQRFQHTAKSCAFEFRCVQCVTKHGWGVCPRTVNKKLPLQCCNCVGAGFKNVNHTANNLHVCGYFKQYHVALFNKISKHVNSNPRQDINSIRSEPNVPANPAPSTSDAFAGPAHANNPNISKRKKSDPKSAHTGWTAVDNKKSKSKNSNKSSPASNQINSGKSHTNSSTGNSNHRVEALIGAFSKLLRDFCHAT